MHRSLLYWLRAAYKANGLAQDASPARNLQVAMRRLSMQWQTRFNELAPKLADIFARRSAEHTDQALASALREAGFTVKFKMTPATNDALQAVMGENVGLIRSIAEQHLTQVQGMVMRSVAMGRDLGQLTQDLTKAYGVTQRRAAFIARDQNNKATAAIRKSRTQELGLTQGKWRHSGAGAHPRPSHVAAHGRVFNIADGCLIDGEYIQPGELSNCRCTMTVIIPGFDDED